MTTQKYLFNTILRVNWAVITWVQTKAIVEGHKIKFHKRLKYKCNKLRPFPSIFSVSLPSFLFGPTPKVTFGLLPFLHWMRWCEKALSILILFITSWVIILVKLFCFPWTLVVFCVKCWSFPTSRMARGCLLCLQRSFSGLRSSLAKL